MSFAEAFYRRFYLKENGPLMTHPEPKIYAPFITALEAEHPKLAPQLVGIGDRPWETDDRKSLVTARFQSAAGTPFAGAYVTDAGSATPAALQFLGKMAEKAKAVHAEDVRLGRAPAPPPQVVAGDDEHDDPEPAPPPEDADAAADDWDEETTASA